MTSDPQITTDEWEQRLGDDVRRLRLRHKLTQSELAERANVSLSTVKHLERGDGSSLSTLIRVARALGRTEWLAGFVPPEPTISPMALLREEQRSAAGAPQRVRHGNPVRIS